MLLNSHSLTHIPIPVKHPALQQRLFFSVTSCLRRPIEMAMILICIVTLGTSHGGIGQCNAAPSGVSVAKKRSDCSAVQTESDREQSATSQPEIPQASKSSDQFDVYLGIDGHLRLGRWAPVVIRKKAGFEATHFEFETLDGDGFGVIYSGPFSQDPDRPEMLYAWIRIGRKVDSVAMRLFNGPNDSNSQPVASVAIPIDLNKISHSTQPLAISISNSSSSREAFESTVTGSKDDKNKIVVGVSDLSLLPSDWLGYDSVESMFLVANDRRQLEVLTQQQVDAIEKWTENGGRVILSVTPDADWLLGESGLLERFSPGKYVSSGSFSNSGPLESFVSSRNRLIPNEGTPISYAKIDIGSYVYSNKDAGKLVLTEGFPLVMRRAKNNGEIVFTSVDLDSDQLTEWPSYGNLVRQLTLTQDETLRVESGPSSKRSGSVSHYGYTDLVGQLRVPLDQFSQVGFVAFTLVASLIVIYILLIGPLDYFLVRKVFRKMELTWITFPLYSILFCGLAYFISQWSKPQEIQLNQLEIIDMDAETGRTRGTIWSNLYCPSSQNLDLAIDNDHPLGFRIDNSITSWTGLPGEGLGGMLTPASPTGPTQTYRHEIARDAKGNIQASINKMPIQVSSSRAFFTQWSADNPMPILSRPKYKEALGEVRGSIKNPLNVELKNCRLLYGSWAYILRRPLEAGGSFDIEGDAVPRELTSILHRLKTLSEDNKDYRVSSEWDPAEQRVTRIADMMMFQKAAGGVRYTGLTHRYHSFVDLSDQLKLDRAILVGEVDNASGDVLLDNGEVKNVKDRITTIVRIAFPVAHEDASR